MKKQPQQTCNGQQDWSHGEGSRKPQGKEFSVHTMGLAVSIPRANQDTATKHDRTKSMIWKIQTNKKQMLKSVHLPNSRKQKPTAHQDNSPARESHFKTVQHRPTREPYTHQWWRKPTYHLKEHERAFAQNQHVMITNAEGTNGVKLDTEASPGLPPQWTGNAEARCTLKQDTSPFYSKQSLIPYAASARGLHQSDRRLHLAGRARLIVFWTSVSTNSIKKACCLETEEVTSTL